MLESSLRIHYVLALVVSGLHDGHDVAEEVEPGPGQVEQGAASDT